MTVPVAALVLELPISLTLDGARRHVRSKQGGRRQLDPRSAEIGALTSRVAVHPELRALVARQRAFVSRHGGVMEGRISAIVVVPGRSAKFFLDASRRRRPRRRHSEPASWGRTLLLAELERQLRERDRCQM
ncbi:MAG: (d)CMP kinase [Thermoanaerobaculia bacterium]